ncbi:winged helix-turn-helix transcriptional regulator [Gordonia soli]|uniref:Putative HxlR family transcriptional regulator n=1 Tax=Gordonia soli NBRC 108243 TaxID=1223545 RepID=M0QMG0_9ACTN|nr:putative HxlR family transcriptional regulator [Gordonia soli NBRC 108243]
MASDRSSITADRTTVRPVRRRPHTYLFDRGCARGGRRPLVVARGPRGRRGAHRCEGIRDRTGAPRQVLTSRLRKLEDAGVLERTPYRERPLRHEYVLTDAGRDLFPALATRRTWGQRHATGD